MAFQDKGIFFWFLFCIVILLTMCFLFPAKANAQIYRVSSEYKKSYFVEEKKLLKEIDWKAYLSGVHNSGSVKDREGESLSRAMVGYRAGISYVKDIFSIGIEGSSLESLDKRTSFLSYLKKQEIGGVLSIDITPNTQPRFYVLLLFGEVKNKSRFEYSSADLNVSSWYIGTGIGLRFPLNENFALSGEYRLKYQKNIWDNFVFLEDKTRHDFSVGINLLF